MYDMKDAMEDGAWQWLWKHALLTFLGIAVIGVSWLCVPRIVKAYQPAEKVEESAILTKVSDDPTIYRVTIETNRYLIAVNGSIIKETP